VEGLAIWVPWPVLSGRGMDGHGQARTNTDKHGRTRTSTDEHGQARTNTDKHGRTRTARRGSVVFRKTLLSVYVHRIPAGASWRSYRITSHAPGNAEPQLGTPGPCQVGIRRQRARSRAGARRSRGAARAFSPRFFPALFPRAFSPRFFPALFPRAFSPRFFPLTTIRHGSNHRGSASATDSVSRKGPSPKPHSTTRNGARTGNTASSRSTKRAKACPATPSRRWCRK